MEETIFGTISRLEEKGIVETMSEHNLFYYPYASFTNLQLPQLKVAALYFDKLVVLDPISASWAIIGADHHSRETDYYMHRLSVHVLAKSETGEMFYVLSYR